MKFFPLFLLLNTAWIFSATYFVSPKGSDSAPGTKESPWASPEGAKKNLRTLWPQGIKENVEVLFEEGIYVCNTSLDFDYRDGGSSTVSVTYKSQPDAQVIFTGADFVTGWKKGVNNLWTTKVALNWKFRQLFVEGVPGVRARHPNLNEPWLMVRSMQNDFNQVSWTAGPGEPNWIYTTSKTSTVGLPRGLIKDWKHPEAIEIVVRKSWSNTRKRIGSLKIADDQIELAKPHAQTSSYNVMKAGRPFYLENALEFLDSPGEWYLSPEGDLSYWARSGEDLNVNRVLAPRLITLAQLKGTAVKPVQNLHFFGIRFAHCDLPLPVFGHDGRQGFQFYIGSWLDEAPINELRKSAGIEVEFAENCSFQSGVIEWMGGTGIALGRGSKNIRIVGNLVQGMGGNGIEVGSLVDPISDEYFGASNTRKKVTGYITKDQIPSGNQVENNKVIDCARDYMGACGIVLFFAENNTVRYNEISGLPYSGISVGWRWNSGNQSSKNNLISNNLIHHVMTYLADGGGIYTLGNQPGTIFRENFIHNIPYHKDAYGSGNQGFFFDEGSSGFLVESNVVAESPGGAYRTNVAGTIEMKNNMFTKGLTLQEAEKSKPTSGLQSSYLFVTKWPENWPQSKTSSTIVLRQPSVNTMDKRIGQGYTINGKRVFSARHRAQVIK